MRERSETKRQTSGSQTRQRGQSVKVALTETERAKVEADAAALGLSLSGYARSLLMGEVTPGTQSRRFVRDIADLGRMLGQLGKVGSNLNQLTRLGNQGEIIPPPELAACLAEVRGVTAQIAEILHGDY